MTLAAAVVALPLQQRETFRALQAFDGWARPIDVGGFDGSHHSKTLRTLVAKGLVDARRRQVGISGGSWTYRARESIAAVDATIPLRSRLP